MDAAVAMLLCQGVCDPLRSGLGGGFFMVVYQRSSRTALAVDAREAAPAKASREVFQDDTTTPGRSRPLMCTVASDSEMKQVDVRLTYLLQSMAQKTHCGTPKGSEIFFSFLKHRQGLLANKLCTAGLHTVGLHLPSKSQKLTVHLLCC